MKMTYEEELTPQDLIYTLHGWEGRDLVFVQRELMSRPIAQTGLTSLLVVVPKVKKKKVHLHKYKKWVYMCGRVDFKIVPC